MEEEKDKSASGFTITGLLQMAPVRQQARANIPLIGQPKPHALLETSLHPLTQDQANIILEDNWTKEVRWFGARLPDVAVLSPVRLARVKHQIIKLLDKPNDCWIVSGSIGDIMITLSYDAASILATIPKDLLQHRGYVLVSLELQCDGQVETEQVECCQFSVLADSDIHVEIDIVKQIKSVFGVNFPRVFPYFVINLRKENAVNHFYVTLKQTGLNSINKNSQN
ncbi:hypothetical protein CRM22_001816 [Opisthorchis felineus]|uniref:Uncharacterized protein n=1 Tax=Opisthorchis felineus TaxID=147828 RepID=A0A4S2M8U2_OPIFE|nr:hypothetical protein CRM22_001816 [Opisthorchis felineus]